MEEKFLALVPVALAVLWMFSVSGVTLADLFHRYFAFSITFVGPVIALWHFGSNILIRRLAASIFYFIVSMVCSSWALIYAMRRYPKEIGVLPDLGHDLSGNGWKNAQFTVGNYSLTTDEIPDMFLVTSVIGTTLWLLTQRTKGIMVTRRVLIIFSTLMFFRCVTGLITILPSNRPDKYREFLINSQMATKLPADENILLSFKSRLLLVLRPMMSILYDVTGSTALLSMSGMTMHTYYPVSKQQLNYVKIFAWVWVGTGLFFIIVTNLHYTLDVVLSFYLTVTVWASYHRIANDVIIGQEWSMVWVVDTLIIYPLIQYFEEGTEDLEIARWPSEVEELERRRSQICHHCYIKRQNETNSRDRFKRKQSSESQTRNKSRSPTRSSPRKRRQPN